MWLPQSGTCNPSQQISYFYRLSQTVQLCSVIEKLICVSLHSLYVFVASAALGKLYTTINIPKDLNDTGVQESLALISIPVTSSKWLNSKISKWSHFLKYFSITPWLNWELFPTKTITVVICIICLI